MTSYSETERHEYLADALNQSQSNSISVLIIGSGIGGLTAARECWRRGFNVRIFERNTQPIYTGGSFSIGSSALSSLRNYPRLRKDVEDIGTKPRLTVYKLDGTLIQGPLDSEDWLSSSANREMVSDVMRLSRPKIYHAMLSHLERLGVVVEYGRAVVDYFEDSNLGRSGVILADGSRQDADIVLAADGVNGHSSRLIFGKKVSAKPSGGAIYRAGYTIDHKSSDPGIADAFGTLEDEKPMVHMYTGEVPVIIVQYMDRIEWSLSHEDDGRARESWDHHPPVADVLALFGRYKNFPNQALRVIESTPPGTLIDWRIMWRESQPQWVSPAGLVVQLGDAAHTFHPSSGNGATQAMEDAVSLATCLSLAGKDNLRWATKMHNLLRFERVSCLQAFDIANQADRKSTSKLPSMGKWILLHDPESYAVEKYELALRHLREGTPFENTNTPPGMVYHPWTIDDLLSARDRGEATVLGGDWS